MPRALRFGLGLHAARSLSEVQDAARRAEDLGYDVLHVPDHLPGPAPFPVLMAAAAATRTLRLGTFVLNAGFYRPALLARDVAALHDLSGGRFEAGLGTGYVEAEFAAAELPFPTAGQRVDHLRRVTEHLRVQVPGVPILIAGNGDRVLRLAARHADVIGLTGGDRPAIPGDDPLGERVAFVRSAAGNRDVELNIAVTAMPTDGSGRPDLRIPRRFLPGFTDEQLLRHPGTLAGSTEEMAARILRMRDEYGVSYVTVQAPHAEAFAAVMGELRQYQR